MPRQLVQFRLTHLFFATAAVASVVTAGIACKSVYETHGYLASYFYPWVFGLLAFMALCSLPFGRLRLPAVLSLIAICSVFSLRQSILAERSQDLKVEVSHIGRFAEEYKLQHGRYPRDLSNYVFERPDLQQFITFYPNDAGGSDLFDSFWIRFHPCDDDSLFPFHGLGIYHAYSRGNFWYEDD